MGALLDASARMYSSKTIIDFAKIVFGDEKAKAGVDERKEELKSMGTNGGHAEYHICRQLMRAFVTFQDKLGETENAAELLKLVKGLYPSDICEEEIANVRFGM